jgi:hypothetical protein
MQGGQKDSGLDTEEDGEAERLCNVHGQAIY